MVEDDASIGHLLVFILEREGFSVHWETHGQNAAAYLLRHEAPTAVVLDIGVPGLDGYALLARIRAHAPWQATPVLMLTAFSQSANVAKAIAAGANDYLLKPFHPDELTKRVRRLCLTSPAA